MFSIWRSTACRVVVAIVSFVIAVDQYRDRVYESRNSGQILDTSALLLPVSSSSFTLKHDSNLQRISFNSPATHVPDTTAIILNWSRLHNVVSIVDTLCGRSLEHTIAVVFVWNNSPQILSHDDFATTRCTKENLRIHNSIKNLYFYARYLACAQATTTYCFIQDDDYLIRPEIINTLRYQIGRPGASPRIHLLPPREMLSSSLRTIYTSSNIHTSFAWLGYGTIVKKSEVDDFLSLVTRLEMSEEELKMADNYFTILSNTVSEIWFDQGIELGGGQPFTVGSEGEKRNNDHIIRATKFLERTLSYEGSISQYVRTGDYALPSLNSYTPCVDSICLFETSISLLPATVNHLASSGDQMLFQEAKNMRSLGWERASHYVAYPPSYAVDGKPDTAFRSVQDAREGDMISLDIVKMIKYLWACVELVLLVDHPTEVIIQSSVFEVGFGNSWVTSNHALDCVDSDIASSSPGLPGFLRECSIRMLPVTGALSESHVFRVRLVKSLEEKWCVHEVWIRGTRSQACI